MHASRGVVILTALAIIASGCLGGSDPASTSDAAGASSPGLAQPADAVGSIEGRVTDDAQAPLPNVTVQLLKTEHKSLTDEVGHYQFSAVEPGTYTIYFDAPGYQGLGKRFGLSAGEVLTVNVVLPSLENIVVAYAETIPRAAYIELGTGNTHSQLLWKFPQYFCSACKIPIEVPGDVRELMLEYTFSPTTDYPNHDEQIYYDYYRNTTVDSPSPLNNEYVKSGWLKDHANVTLPKGTGGLKPGIDKLTLYVGGDQDPYITNQQKVYAWITFAHNGPIPAGYSGAPPKT